jgi:hypothetical protein
VTDGEAIIEGWRCYVSGDQLRHAESNGGFCMQVDKDGGLAGDNCYCPPAVVAWLFEPLHAQLRASEAEVARLTRELDDVRKLDAVFTHQQLALWADGWAATLDRLDAPTLTAAGYPSPAAARRAAVEYLEKESKGG